MTLDAFGRRRRCCRRDDLLCDRAFFAAGDADGLDYLAVATKIAFYEVRERNTVTTSLPTACDPQRGQPAGARQWWSLARCVMVPLWGVTRFYYPLIILHVSRSPRRTTVVTEKQCLLRCCTLLTVFGVSYGRFLRYYTRLTIFSASHTIRYTAVHVLCAGEKR